MVVRLKIESQRFEPPRELEIERDTIVNRRVIVPLGNHLAHFARMCAALDWSIRLCVLFSLLLSFSRFGLTAF